MNWPIKKFPKILDSSTKVDMKFNISLTTTALLMMEMTIFIPLCEHIWVEKRHSTLILMVLIRFVEFLTRSHLKLFLMLMISSEKVGTITIAAIGKLNQWFWKHKIKKTFALKLKPIVKKMTMRYPMRTLFSIEKL